MADTITDARRSELFGLWADEMMEHDEQQLPLCRAYRDNLTDAERELVLMWDTARILKLNGLM